MMKKKGFTLVELLAVIAILSILVIMALPAVLRIYKQGRVAIFQNEIRGAYTTAQQQFLDDGRSMRPGDKIVYTNGCDSVSGANVKRLELSGDSNFKYYIEVGSDGKIISIKASNGSYSYIKTGNNIKIVEINVENGNGVELDTNIADDICTAVATNEGNGSENETSITYVNRQVEGAITAGDEVAIDSEHFYILSTNSTKTVLLAKYNLYVGEKYTTMSNGSNWQYAGSLTSSDEGYGLQSANAGVQSTSSSPRIGSVAFAGMGYWDEYELYADMNSSNHQTEMGLKSKYSENGASYDGDPYPYVYDSSMSSVAPSNYTISRYANDNGYVHNNGYTIAYFVEEYVNRLKDLGAPSNVTGRLISYEEAISTSSSIRGGASYWTGSAYDYMYIYISGNNVFKANYGENSNNYYGVRPVIEVPTSSIE